MTDEERFKHWCPKVVEDIKSDNPAGQKELYKYLCGGLRYRLLRKFGPQDVDDHVHSVFARIVKAIKQGNLKDPTKLLPYARTISQHYACEVIEYDYKKRSRLASIEDWNDLRVETCNANGLEVYTDHFQNPEQAAIKKQKITRALEALKKTTPREHEVLTRFYLHEQTPDEIKAAMGIGDITYRNLKNRGKDNLCSHMRYPGVTTGRKMCTCGKCTRCKLRAYNNKRLANLKYYHKTHSVGAIKEQSKGAIQCTQ